MAPKHTFPQRTLTSTKTRHDRNWKLRATRKSGSGTCRWASGGAETNMMRELLLFTACYMKMTMKISLLATAVSCL